MPKRKKKTVAAGPVWEQDWFWLLLLLSCVLYMYWPLLAQRVFLWFDVFNQGQIRREFTGLALAQGRIPFWDPSVYGGAPFLADPQNSVFYPFHLLTGVLAWLNQSYKLSWHVYIVVLETLFGGLGFYVLSRRNLGFRPASSFLSTAIFLFSTPMICRILQYAHYTEMVCIPWILIGVMGLRQGGATYVLGLGCLWGITLLGGNQQYSYYIAMAVGIYAVVDITSLWQQARSFRPVPRLVGKYAAFVAIGFGLSAISLLPVAEYFSISGRGFVKPSGTPLKYLITYLLPSFFGKIAGGPGPYFGHEGFWSYWEFSMYVGIVALVLSVLTISLPKRDRVWWYCLVLILFSWCYAFGVENPLPRLLPFGASIRIPGKYLIFAAFSFSLLAGMTLNAFLSGAFSRDAGRRWLYVTVVAIGVVAVAATVWRTSLCEGAERLPAAYIEVVRGGAWRTLIILCVTGGIVWTWLRRPYHVYLLAALLMGVTLLDLIAYNRSFHGSRVSSDQYYAVFPQIKMLQQEMKKEPFRIEGGPFTSCNLRATHYGLQALNGYSAVSPPWFRDLGKIKNVDQERYFDLLNVKYVFEQTPSGMRIRERRRVLPRAFIVRRLTVVDPTNMVERLAQPDFDPWQEALVTPEWSHLPAYTNTPVDSSVSVDSYQPEEIRLSVCAGNPGYLVMSESRYPGWHVSIDGVPASWFPVNHSFRGVAVPEGTHSVVWRYKSKSFFCGALITCASVLAVISAYLFCRWRSAI